MAKIEIQSGVLQFIPSCKGKDTFIGNFTEFKRKIQCKEFLRAELIVPSTDLMDVRVSKENFLEIRNDCTLVKAYFMNDKYFKWTEEWKIKKFERRCNK